MAVPYGPSAPRHFPVAADGTIGPVRKDLLARAKAWLGELAAQAGSNIDIANAAIAAGIRGATGTQSLPDVTNVMTPGEATGLVHGGEALIDSSNGLPLVRMDRGISSLQVDPRIVDAAAVGLPAAAAVGRVAADTAFALGKVVPQAAMEASFAGR